MRRLIILMVVLVLALLLALLLAPAARARSGPLAADPPALEISGTLERGAFAASLRLASDETLGGVQLVATDLVDATGDGVYRDPLPSSVVTLQPAEFVTLTAGSLAQVVVRVAPPPAAGVYSGTLLVRWSRPAVGQLDVPLAVVARTLPGLAVEGDVPVTVGGVCGSEERRQVTLRETGARGSPPLTGLRAVPQGLHTADGGTLEAARVSVALPADRVASGRLLTATIGIDLAGAAPGAYVGSVLFESDAGEPLSLPLAVTVRAGPVWPILLLVLGVAAGLLLSAYRERGKQRDQLVLRIVAVRRELERADGPQGAFCRRIESCLAKAEAAVRDRSWEQAQAAVQAARDALHKWHGGDWQAQMDYLKEIGTRIEGLLEQSEAITLKTLRHRIHTALETAVDADDPGTLGEQAVAIEAALLRYEAAREQWDEMCRVRSDAPSSLRDKKEAWRLKLDDLGQRLDLLPPDDQAGWQALEQALRELGEEMVREIEAAGSREVEEWATKGPGIRGYEAGADGDVPWARLGRLLSIPVGDEPRPPAAGPFTWQDARRARRGLARFALLTTALGGLVLAALGYSTLYLGNPAFGAQPVTDYLALLAWGLGAQTTFTSVAGLLRGWDVPFAGAE